MTIVPFPPLPPTGEDNGITADEIRRIDEALFLIGDFGRDKGNWRRWSSDRPLTLGEAEKALTWFGEAGDDPAEVARRSEVLRDYLMQLDFQVASFRACAAALLSNDTGKLLPDGPGRGSKEARKLIESRADLLSPAGLADPAARTAIRQEVERVAALFLRAATDLRAIADAIALARGVRDGDRLRSRVTDLYGMNADAQ
jgi:hypothetical protein